MTLEELKAFDTQFVPVRLAGKDLGCGTVFYGENWSQVFIGMGDVCISFRPSEASWDGALNINVTGL